MLILPDTLTLAEAEDVLRLARLAAGPDSPPVLEVEAGGLERFDSSALAVLLEARRQALAWGRGFRLLGLPHGLLELARLYGVEALLFPPGEGLAADGAGRVEPALG